MFRHYYFLKLRSSFLHEEREGSEAPIRRMARWGLQVNIHTTSFMKIKFQDPRVCFYDYFSQLFARAVGTWTGLNEV